MSDEIEGPSWGGSWLRMNVQLIALTDPWVEQCQIVHSRVFAPEVSGTLELRVPFSRGDGWVVAFLSCGEP